MKRSTKVVSIIIIFFLIIASVIVARTMIGKHFQKKFGKRPPPGIIVTQVIEKKFEEFLNSICEEPVCECGAEKIGMPSHSHWCPKHGH